MVRLAGALGCRRRCVCGRPRGCGTRRSAGVAAGCVEILRNPLHQVHQFLAEIASARRERASYGGIEFFIRQNGFESAADAEAHLALPAPDNHDRAFANLAYADPGFTELFGELARRQISRGVDGDHQQAIAGVFIERSADVADAAAVALADQSGKVVDVAPLLQLRGIFHTPRLWRGEHAHCGQQDRDDPEFPGEHRRAIRSLNRPHLPRLLPPSKTSGAAGRTCHTSSDTESMRAPMRRQSLQRIFQRTEPASHIRQKSHVLPLDALPVTLVTDAPVRRWLNMLWVLLILVWLSPCLTWKEARFVARAAEGHNNIPA